MDRTRERGALVPRLQSLPCHGEITVQEVELLGIAMPMAGKVCACGDTQEDGTTLRHRVSPQVLALHGIRPYRFPLAFWCTHQKARRLLGEAGTEPITDLGTWRL